MLSLRKVGECCQVAVPLLREDRRLPSTVDFFLLVLAFGVQPPHWLLNPRCARLASPKGTGRLSSRSTSRELNSSSAGECQRDQPQARAPTLFRLHDCSNEFRTGLGKRIPPFRGLLSESAFDFEAVFLCIPLVFRQLRVQTGFFHMRRGGNSQVGNDRTHVRAPVNAEPITGQSRLVNIAAVALICGRFLSRVRALLALRAV